MSGTLRELKNKDNNFLGIKFYSDRKFCLENKNKLFLSRLTHVGPNNKYELDFRYNNQKNKAHLINFYIRIKPVLDKVPNGILFIFPNYQFMDFCYKELKNHSFKQIIFKESEDKEESEQIAQKYF